MERGGGEGEQMRTQTGVLWREGLIQKQNGLIFFVLSFLILTFQFIPFLPKDKEKLGFFQMIKEE